MEDKELFELCRSVYEKTKWLPDDLHQAYYHRGHYFSQDNEYDAEEPELHDYEGTLVDFPVKFDCPLYTSDYILEKLPNYFQEKYGDKRYLLTLDVSDTWCAYYGHGSHQMFTCNSDTPLKALLKLTLALHEAGELK